MNETISQSYKEMQIQLHQDPNYGVMSIEMAPMVLNLAQNNGVKASQIMVLESVIYG